MDGDNMVRIAACNLQVVPMYDFVALDVETANRRMASICRVAAVRFERGQIVDQFDELVDPNDEFDPGNTRIHGVSAADVYGAPTFLEVLDQLQDFVGGHVVAHHHHFDRTAIFQACASCGNSEPPLWQWLDSVKLARRAWPELIGGGGGHGLANLCQVLGHDLDHHNALADAITCGAVVLAAAALLPGFDIKDFANW